MPRIITAVPTNKQETKSVVKRALYTGAVAATAGYFLLNETGESSIFNIQMPAAATVAIGAATGSVVSDLLSDYLIGSDQSATSELETQAVKLGLASIGSMGALYLGSGIPPSILGAAVGAGSKAAGDYTYQTMDAMLVGTVW